MRRRRYVYTYSPRRGYVGGPPDKRSGGHWALAIGSALALLAVWLVAGGYLSADAGSDDLSHVRTAGRSSWRLPTEPVEASSQQGGGAPTGVDEVVDEIVERNPPEITALAAVVLEEPCGAVLHELNAGLRLPPASLTKIATALVAVEHADLVQTITVNVSGSELSATADATVMGIEPGERLSVLDLLYGMLLPSGSDAAIALAEYVSGSQEAFVELMNAKVEELGLTDTQFTNPDGLDDPGLYTSAYDIAMLARQLLRVPELAYIVRTPTYQPAWDGPPLQNHNLLLSLYPGAIGVKTGYTYLAGQTLVAAAERNGRRIIVSVLGSSDIYPDVIALLDWAFEGAPSKCESGTGVSAPAG